jgi:hypothetical protein
MEMVADAALFCRFPEVESVYLNMPNIHFLPVKLPFVKVRATANRRFKKGVSASWTLWCIDLDLSFNLLGSSISVRAAFHRSVIPSNGSVRFQ